MLATAVSEKTQAFIEQFKAADIATPVWERLESMELPTRRTEAWKYTRTAKISNADWKVNAELSEVDWQQYRIPDLDAWEIVMVNGKVLEDQAHWASLQAHLIAVKSERDAVGELISFPSIFSTLNEAASTERIDIALTRGQDLQKPIHFIQIGVGDGAVSMPRWFVNVPALAGLELIFTTVSEDRVLHNELGEYMVADNASLKVTRIQRIGAKGFQLNHDSVKQGRDSRVTFNTVTAGSQWVRNDLHAALHGENIETNMNGAYRLEGNEHCDNHTVVDHLKPHCESNEMYKGLLTDKSTGVFNGKVFVREDAQKTNAFQQNANIVLSDDASMNSKPELEIYADDVKCSHGSTTGQIDEEALFYLKSRGLSEASARQMLESAFLGEVLENMAEGPLLAHLRAHLHLPE